MKYKYGTREHCGGLKESIATSRYISEEKFKRLLPMYKYYGYDSRVSQFMFILRDIEKYYKQYKVWLFIEISINN